MTDEPKDLLGKLAARSRDVVTLGAAGALLLSVLYIVLDNVAVRARIGQALGLPEMRLQLDTISDQLNQLSHNSASAREERLRILERIHALEGDDALDKSPALRFVDQGSSITDGQIGGLVKITWSFIKLRDCGAPKPEDWFFDAEGAQFRFEDVSIVDNFGRGMQMEPDPSRTVQITYTARIPAGRGVVPGQAHGWVVVSNYENCPGLAPVRSPTESFRIHVGEYDPDGGPASRRNDG
jgi:hypothetical protein